jgi:hypothetical protein
VATGSPDGLLSDHVVELLGTVMDTISEVMQWSFLPARSAMSYQSSAHVHLSASSVKPGKVSRSSSDARAVVRCVRRYPLWYPC